MGERDPSLGAFVDEVRSYFRVMSEMPAPPDADTPNGPGWYVQSPSDTTTYATDPWLSVSDVEVAYAAPTLVVTFRWTQASSFGTPAGLYALVLDGTVPNAEKCTIRVEEFLTRKTWHEGAQRTGNILVVAVPSPTE